jgi:hypothetical protein
MRISMPLRRASSSNPTFLGREPEECGRAEPQALADDLEQEDPVAVKTVIGIVENADQAKHAVEHAGPERRRAA